MVTKSQIAGWMLEWEEAQKATDMLADAIQEAVLELGETFDVGNIRASFANPRKSYRWEESGQVASQEIIDGNTEHIPEEVIPAFDKTDWKTVCQEAGITPMHKITSVAKVTMKMID